MPFPQNTTNPFPFFLLFTLSDMIASVQCALPIISGNTTLTDGIESESPRTPNHGNNHGLKDHEFVFIDIICLWIIGAC